MKVLTILLLVTLTFINGDDYKDARYLILDDSDTTLDGEKLTEKGVFYKEEFGEVAIQEPGTYYVSGRLTGQLEITLAEDEKIVLILDGVKITNTKAPALLIKKGYEFNQPEDTAISLEEAKSLDFSDVGVRIILADDSINTITGSHSEKHDGAISSKVSMAFSGEKKGNGVLNLIADYEGMEIKNHLLIEGGVINIASQDDGINLKKDSISVGMVNGGRLVINAGLGREGDGFDSNGYLIINDGTIISAAITSPDCGLDSNLGLLINGGDVLGFGGSMDKACKLGTQPAFNLKFASNVKPGQVLKIEDSKGKEVFSFTSSNVGLMKDTAIRDFKGVTISLKNFTMDNTYKIYLDNVLLGHGGGIEQEPEIFMMPPMDGNRTHGGNGGRPPMDGNHTQHGGRPPKDGNHTQHGGMPPMGNGTDFPDFPGGMPFGGRSKCNLTEPINSTDFSTKFTATTFNCIREAP